MIYHLNQTKPVVYASHLQPPVRQVQGVVSNYNVLVLVFDRQKCSWVCGWWPSCRSYRICSSTFRLEQGLTCKTNLPQRMRHSGKLVRILGSTFHGVPTLPNRKITLEWKICFQKSLTAFHICFILPKMKLGLGGPGRAFSGEPHSRYTLCRVLTII